MPTFTAGTPYNGTITVNNATSATVTGLPTGVSVASTTVSGTDLIITLSGTPTVSGESFNIQVAATNACGGGLTTSTNTGSAASGTVAAPSCPTPVNGNLTPLVGNVGASYTGSLTISNATSGSITNLPAGLTQSGAASGTNYVITVTGTPTAAATTALLVDANNACGGGSTTTSITNSAAGSLVIGAALVCPTPDAGDITTTSGVVGITYSGTITVTNATSATITNLPAGLSQSGAPNGTSYVITVTGQPTTAGTTSLLVNSTNACGSGYTTTTASQQQAGAIVVSPSSPCTTPSVGTLTVLTGTVNAAFSTATLTVLNATTATITNLPAGLSQSGAVSGSNYVITVTGTPTVSGTTTLAVNATNSCATGTPSSVSGQSGGVLTINAAQLTWNSADCCGAAVDTLAGYTPGDLTTIAPVGGLQISSTNPNATIQLYTTYGCSAVPDSCNFPMVLITNTSRSIIYAYKYLGSGGDVCPGGGGGGGGGGNGNGAEYEEK
jgi:hypothetical protein